MRAAYIETYGQTPTIADLPELVEGEHPVAAVVAAGINPVDLSIAGGEFYAVRPKPPYTPGMEGVARRADGSQVYFSRPGDLKHGSLAEQVYLGEETFDIPAGTDPVAAISCGIAGLAGYLSVLDRGKLVAGEQVVIVGATGAAGRIAVQVAKLAGASQVVAVGRNQAALEEVKALGADETVWFHGPMYMHEVEIGEKTGGGHSLTIDFTWGAPAMAALNAGAKDSRLIQVGNAASEGAGISAHVLRGGNYTIQGYSNFNVPLERRREAFGELLAQVADGQIKLHAETVDLEEVPAAWERQRKSPGAKLVTLIG